MIPLPGWPVMAPNAYDNNNNYSVILPFTRASATSECDRSVRKSSSCCCMRGTHWRWIQHRHWLHSILLILHTRSQTTQGKQTRCWRLVVVASALATDFRGSVNNTRAVLPTLPSFFIANDFKNGRINNVGAKVPGNKLVRVLLQLSLWERMGPGSEKAVIRRKWSISSDVRFDSVHFHSVSFTARCPPLRVVYVAATYVTKW